MLTTLLNLLGLIKETDGNADRYLSLFANTVASREGQTPNTDTEQLNSTPNTGTTTDTSGDSSGKTVSDPVVSDPVETESPVVGQLAGDFVEKARHLRGETTQPPNSGGKVVDNGNTDTDTGTGDQSGGTTTEETTGDTTQQPADPVDTGETAATPGVDDVAPNTGGTSGNTDGATTPPNSGTTTDTPNGGTSPNDPEVVVEPSDPEPVVTAPEEPETTVQAPNGLTETGGSLDGPAQLDPTTVDSDSLDIDGGRVTTLEVDADEPVDRVEILSDLDHGHVTVNPDNTIAVVMSGSDYTGALSFDYKVTYADGTTEVNTLSLNVTPPSHDAGWGLGKHYMLEEDEDGDLVVETGENHRKVYVSESDDALSRADIAALEGLSEEDITDDWLAENGEYGATEDLALKTDVAEGLWSKINSPHLDEPNSNWLLFENGYSYDFERIVTPKLDGESELHPVHVTSWGEGERAEITPRQLIHQYDSSNIVFSDLTLTGGVLSLSGSNVIFHDTLFTDEGLNIQFGSGFTLHDSEVTHVVNDPNPDSDTWSGTKAGLFSRETDNWLIEGTIFHHNGWEDDYHADWSTEGGMPPNTRSHNVYLQNNTSDVTFRDNIVAEGSSFGAHIRGGGYVEDNLFLDNNNAVDLLGGIYAGEGAIGNFSFFADNVITSGAHKETDYFDGGLTRGITNSAYDTTLLDNIVAHLADPNNPDDVLDKWRTNYALLNENTPTYDNTLIYNWIGNDPNRTEKAMGEYEDRNTENLDTDLANQTTIQNFAAALMGTDEATLRELMDYLVSLGDTPFDDSVTAADIVAYFQNGFGLDGNGDEAQTDHRFIPNDLGDGVRWDNRINWDTEDVPDDGDNVDLAGNWVQYGGTTAVGDLDLGEGGKLSVNHGKLSVDGTLETGGDATISTEGAGQFWTDGFTDADGINLDLESGRFANTGNFTGPASIDVSGDAQAILASDDARLRLGADSELRITGSEADVGFDGDENGTAVLQMKDGATLSFVADADGFSGIEEFRSGAWDQDEALVESGASVNGSLQIDLTEYAGGASSTKLIDVDALDGIFDDIHVYGLQDNLDAKLVMDYTADELLLEITEGSGQLSYAANGSAGDSSGESADLWAALTAGQGFVDESTPDLHTEDDALPDLALL